MGVDAISPKSPQTTVPVSQPIEAKKVEAPPAAAPSAPPTKPTEGFDAQKTKPVSITGKHAAGEAPPANAELAKEVAAQRSVAQAGDGGKAGKKADPVYAPRYEDVKAGKSAIAPDTKGPAVKKVQEELEMAGYDVKVNGTYDAKTKAAITEFQKSHGIKTDKQNPAGWTDGRTLNALEKDMAVRRETVAKHTGDDKKAVLALVKSPGFNALDNKERDVLLKTVGGKGPQSGEVRQQFNEKVLADDYKTKSPAEQTAALRDYMKKSQHLPGNVSSPPGQHPKAAEYKLEVGKPDQHGVTLSKMQIDGREVTITSKNAGQGNNVSVEAAAKAFASMPKRDRDAVRQMEIKGRPHKESKAVAAAFDEKRSQISIYENSDNLNHDSFTGTMIHETAHGHAFKAFGEEDGPNWKTWKDAIASDGLPPSKYAANTPVDADEDFAETYHLYQLVKDDPAAMAEARAKHPARFKVIDSMVK